MERKEDTKLILEIIRNALAIIYSLSFNKSSRSKILYLQLTLGYIYNRHVLVDGNWGPQTARAVKDIFEQLGINGTITIKKHWLNYLDLTGKIAFRLFEPSKNPLTLLNNVYAAITDLAAPEKHALLESLNKFRHHNTTENWLNNFLVNKDVAGIIEEVKLIV